MPVASLLPLLARSHIPDLIRKDHWLLVLALTMAIWGACSSLAFNAVLGGPQVSAVWHTLVKYTLGDFLGMLMLLLPALLWQRRPRSERKQRHFCATESGRSPRPACCSWGSP
ncbi:MASE1 domain-containing protein [Erwinia aphidicola]|uniref:MASE1 domain-containing protein n=1 Tax=Erwinia aphidicola TaxID=68334 RepID=UPI003BAE2CC4